MRRILPVLLLVIGLGMFAVGVPRVVGAFLDLRTIGGPLVTPGSTTVFLEAGDYAVYEDVGFRPEGAPASGITVDPATVRVTGPDGPVATGCLACGSARSTLTIGTTTYVGLVSFSVVTDGDYTVSAEGSGAEVVVGPSIGGTLGSIFGSLGLTIGGIFLGIAGAVWLVVATLTSRRPGRGTSATMQASGPVQGPTPSGSWYPDPQDPAQLRWWDGRQWTDHQRPR